MTITRKRPATTLVTSGQVPTSYDATFQGDMQAKSFRWVGCEVNYTRSTGTAVKVRMLASFDGGATYAVVQEVAEGVPSDAEVTFTGTASFRKCWTWNVAGYTHIRFQAECTSGGASDVATLKVTGSE